MPFHHAIVTGLATSRGQQKHPNEVGPNQSAALRSDRRVGQIKMPPDPATQTPGPLQNAEPGPLQLAEIRRLNCREGALLATAADPGPSLGVEQSGAHAKKKASRDSSGLHERASTDAGVIGLRQVGRDGDEASHLDRGKRPVA
jgi:hypothetical protein